MQKTLDFINKQHKGLYMTVEDKNGPLADGIYEKMEWFLPADIYLPRTDGTCATPMLRVYLRKKYEDDPYEVNEDGFIVVEADPMTLRLVSLDNQGNRIE